MIIGQSSRNLEVVHSFAHPALLDLQISDWRQHSLVSSSEVHAHGHELAEVCSWRNLANHARLPGLDPLRHKHGATNNRFHSHPSCTYQISQSRFSRWVLKRGLPTKTDGLLGITWNVDFVEPCQAGLRVGFLNEVGDVGVVGTATTHEDLIDLSVLRGEARIMLTNGLCRDASKSCDHIIFVSSSGLDLVDQVDCLLISEDFTTRGFGDVMLVPPVVVDVVVNDFLEAFDVRQ
jgi:hypothetical protein